MQFKINPATVVILSNYGWTENRSVDTSGYEAHYAETNQLTSPLVFAFLQSFGGLKIKGMLVDPLEAYRSRGEEVYKYYEKWIMKPFCFVGFLGDSVMLMTVTGEIYSAWSGYVHLWGATVEEALDNILVNRKFTRIPVPEEMIPPKPKPPSPPPEGTNFGIKRNKDWSPVFQTVTVRGIDFEMCKVPPGSFRMGRDDGNKSSKPAHDQYMTQSYWMSVRLVTNLQWEQAVQQNTGVIKEPEKLDLYDDPDKAQHPVVWISWHQCQDFVNWLGEAWRLPTEAEWEFAARGPDNLIDPLGGRPEGVTWIGAQDMGGRILEWTASIYWEYPYNPSDGRENLIARGSRTMRNAGWQVSSSRSADASQRTYRSASSPYKFIGMRLCITEL